MKLRTRILKDGIRCTPWRLWRGEIELLPISSKTLWRRNGVPVDTLEISLVNEGFLAGGEQLMVVLQNAENLKRSRLGEEGQAGDCEPFDSTWTEEDYKAYYGD